MEMHIHFFYKEDDKKPIFKALYKDYDYSAEVVYKNGSLMNVDHVLYSKMNSVEKRYFDANFNKGTFKIIKHWQEGFTNLYDVTPLIE